MYTADVAGGYHGVRIFASISKCLETAQYYSWANSPFETVLAVDPVHSDLVSMPFPLVLG